MTLTDVNNNTVSPSQLFCILYCVRLSALLLSGDISVIKLGIQLIITVALSAVSLTFFLRKNNKIVSLLLAFVVSAPSIIRLAVFKQNAVAVGIPTAAVFLIFILAVGYSSSLGIRSAARVSLVGAAFLFICVASGVSGNINGAEPFPLETSVSAWLPLEIIQLFDVPAVILLLRAKIKKSAVRAAFLSVGCAYFSAFLLFVICALKLKNAAEFYPYPVFTLLQLAQAGEFNKLDILFTVPLITAEYIKYTVVFSEVRN